MPKNKGIYQLFRTKGEFERYTEEIRRLTRIFTLDHVTIALGRMGFRESKFREFDRVLAEVFQEYMLEGGLTMANEKRLIDAKAGKKVFSAIAQPAEYKGVIHMVVPISEIDKLPTVDAVPVVRCRECKHLNVLNRKELYAHCPKTNTVFLPFDLDTREHFCSLGERKDGAN